MIEVPITEAAIGSTIAAPVYSADGTLLVIDGASVSAQILKMLPKFGIEKIYVSEIFKETIDEKLMKGQLDNLTYLAIRKLNINEIAKCANILVTNIMNNKEYPLLSVLFDVDEDTAKHSFNVACLVLNAAIQMNYSLSELHNLAVGAFMHDIGKLDIPKEILQDDLDHCMRIPMTDNVRALNLSNCVAICVYEVLRQQEYRDLLREEPHKGSDYLERED